MTKKCIIPWIHVNIEPNGNVFPCCMSDTSIGQMGNVNETNLIDIWNGEKYTQLRQQMIDEVEPPSCEHCYRIESMGAVSKRLRENKMWEKYWHLTENANPKPVIKYLDVRFSSICNFKCRMCWPNESHSIAHEYKELGWIPHNIGVLRFDQNNFVGMFDSNINDLEEIYFCGGEPLLMEEHYQLLDKLIEAGNTNVKIRYSSNLSKLEFKHHNVLNYWKHFKNVHVVGSLDGIENKLEYIRHGSDYANTLKNLSILKSLPNVDLRLSCTISIFNILDFKEILETYVSLGFIDINGMGGNVLDDPEFYCVQSLHPSLKPIAKTRLEELLTNQNLSDEFRRNIEYLIKFMMREDTYSTHHAEFLRVTKALDDHRGENFVKTFPELKVHYG